MNRRPSPALIVAPRPAGQVRIIGGRWRGSKLPVADVSGLRPTADRVRETLFNWLQSEIAGARVLDLFAGSGALGFEAASRGAAHVDLVEASPVAAATLRESAERLSRGDASDAGRMSIHSTSAADALAASARQGRAWEIVFIDPPFAANLWDATLAALPPCLAPRAHVYVEAPTEAAITPPTGWVLHRELATREARACLYRVESI